VDRRYEQIIPIKIVTKLPDGNNLVTMGFGKQGTSVATVLRPPAEKDTERDRQEGHDRVQGVMNDISIHIRQDKATKRKEEMYI